MSESRVVPRRREWLEKLMRLLRLRLALRFFIALSAFV
jgi:hypothetical protein